MDEISNNTLLFLAIIAIGISVFGIYTTLINIGPNLITGAPVGTANVTVSQATTITINPANISFVDTALGEGRNSSLATDNGISCSNNFCGLNITNDGNVLVDISLDVSDDLFTSASANTTSMQCRVNPVGRSAGNYGNGDAGVAGIDNSTKVYTSCVDSVGNIGNNGTEFIDALNFTNGGDNAYVDVWISVPIDEITGTKLSTLSFTAAANVVK